MASFKIFILLISLENITYIQNIQDCILIQWLNQIKKTIFKNVRRILKAEISSFFYFINSFMYLIFFFPDSNSWLFAWLNNSSLLSTDLIASFCVYVYIHAN